MKILEVLSESWPGPKPLRAISNEEFISIAKNENHPHHYMIQMALFKPARQIYRGFWSGSNDILAIDVSKTPIRQSINTSNLYTWWIDDISHKWKDFPKRSKSFICSTDEETAGGFGYPHLMIPLTIGPTTVGQCPDGDFWNSFGAISNYTANEFNDVIENLLSLYIDDLDLSSLMGFKTAITQFDEMLKTDEKMRSHFKSAMNQAIKSHKINDTSSLYSAIDSYYDPVDNNFMIKKWPNSFMGSDVEVWFSADCYAIPLKQVSIIKASI